MPPNPKNERIGDLERDLYSRDAQPITAKDRPNLSSHEKQVLYGWKEENKLETDSTAEAVKMKQTDHKTNLVMKFFMASVLFFLVAAGIAAYVILGGFNVISSNNVDISVQGLVAVDAGQELSLDIIIKNRNNAILESGNVYVTYPEGTRTAQDLTKELTRDQLDLGVVPAGGSVTKTVKAVLFGEKDSVKHIKISINYKTQGSNADFSKEKSYDILIKSSPVIMTTSVPQEVNSGQDVILKIDVASNSNTDVRDLLVRAEYPFGFTFTSATPKPTFENNVWSLGDFNPNEKQTITIHGKMDGQNEEERTFRFMTGTSNSTDENQIAINYIATQQSVVIKKAFIDLTLRLNDKLGDAVVSAGDRVQGVLTWSNNLPIAINDAVVKVKLSGSGLDRQRVSQSNGGFFNSSDNTITWDKNSLSSLRNIDPGTSGSVNFTLSALQGTQQLFSQGRNLNIVMDASVAGTRVQGGVPQQITSALSGQAKVSTNLAGSAKILYTNGAFRNTGAMPPKAERETTYTVVLNLSNSFNDVANATIKTKLPPYVRWLSNVLPSSENVVYDESTRTVSWNVADLRAGAGYTNSAKEVAFQISFKPSLSQVGTTPDLTGPFTVSGTDRFTGVSVLLTNPALNTRLTADSGFRDGNDRVTQ